MNYRRPLSLQFQTIKQRISRHIYPTASTPTSHIATINYEELRSIVRSIWKKKLPQEQTQGIYAFLIPKGEEVPVDYAELTDGNYKALMQDVCFDKYQCVFYELESRYSLKNSGNAIFNEYLVTSSPSSFYNNTCPVMLHSVIFA